jgi:hypothetical protein
MIAYYRVFYDLQIADFTTTKYLFIHKPLSSYEISQEDLAIFINGNQESVSFKCLLNENIYAICRILQFKSEVKLPIDEQALFDIFIFPTPIKNKTPDYIESKSIKCLKPATVKTKLDNLDPSS